MRISYRQALPPDILSVLYNDYCPQLFNFGITLPGIGGSSSSISDLSHGCETKEYSCDWCRGAMGTCGMYCRIDDDNQVC